MAISYEGIITKNFYAVGMDYYMDAMENHGLKGHLPQPENFTTCGKLGIEINQYNCPIEVSVIGSV